MEEREAEALEAVPHDPVSIFVPSVLDLMDAPMSLLPPAEDPEASEVRRDESAEAPSDEDAAADPAAPASEAASPREDASEADGSDGEPARSDGDGEGEESSEAESGGPSIDDETAALLGAQASASSPAKTLPAAPALATRRETLLASAVGALGALTRGSGTGDAEKDKENAVIFNAERMKVRVSSGLPMVLRNPSSPSRSTPDARMRLTADRERQVGQVLRDFRSRGAARS